MNFKYKIIISLIIGFILYMLLLVYADMDSLLNAFSNFNWKYLPIILGLTLLNYFFRFLKWDYYVKHLGIKINKKQSAGIFLSGLSMSVTPAKLGESIKSYLLKKIKGVKISKSLPIVFAERLTDLIGLIILAAIGYSTFNYGKGLLLIVFIIIIIGILILQFKNFCLKLLKVKIFFISKFFTILKRFYESTYSLLKIKPLFIGIIISVFSWFFECLALFFVLKSFGLDPSILLSIFSFSFSTIAGSVSMIPGGLVVAEGSLAGILFLGGITKAIAIASTIIIRFATLWFGVLVGIITLTLYGYKINKISKEIEK